MNVYDLAQVVILGLAAGTLTGMIPGFGIFAAILLFFSYLKTLDAFSIMLFYMAVISASQYVGSIVAIYLGVPGEQTSLIASKHGFRLNLRNTQFGQMMIAGTAVSSLIGAAVAMAAIWISFDWVSTTASLFSVKIQLMLIFFIGVFLIFYNRSQSKFLNLILISLGLFMGSLGFNSIQDFSVTFGQEWLLPGLNPAIVTFMLFVIPNLLGYSAGNHDRRCIDYISLKFSKGIGIVSKHWTSIVRGSLIGSLIGLVPGVGTSACSQVAAGVEQKSRKGLIAQTMSAETANNSAVLTSLIPLLLFGLPILPSEAIISDLISTKGPPVGETWFLSSIVPGFNKLELFMTFAILCNIVMAMIAWWGASTLGRLYQWINPKLMTFSIIMIMTALVVVDSIQHVRWQLDFGTVLVLLPLTWIVMKKKIDTLPLIFSFMMADLVQKVFAVTKNLYF